MTSYPAQRANALFSNLSVFNAFWQECASSRAAQDSSARVLRLSSPDSAPQLSNYSLYIPLPGHTRLRRCPSAMETVALPCGPDQTPSSIEEEVVTPEEYSLLTAAILQAEYIQRCAHTKLAVSSYLSRPIDTAENFTPILTLRPRPRFTKRLQGELLPLSFRSNRSGVPALHKELYFALEVFPQLHEICRRNEACIDIPQGLIDPFVARARIPAPAESEIVTGTSPIWNYLLPFQKVAVLQAVQTMKGRVLLSDDMGLGKTLQALAIAQYYRMKQCDTRVLILCPSTLRSAWTHAISKWLHVPEHAIHAPTNAREVAKLNCLTEDVRDAWDSVADVQFVVVSYDLLCRVENEMVGYNIVIADECHFLKNSNAKRSRAAAPILNRARYVVMISATPALNRPLELFAPLACILSTWGGFVTMDEYVMRYCPLSGRGGNNLDELQVVLGGIMIRRTKQVLGQLLPKKHRRMVKVEISSSAREEMRRLRNEAQCIDDGIARVEDQNGGLRQRRDAIFASLYSKTADAKIPGIVTRVRQLLRQRRKFIVFAQHTCIIDAVEALAIREQVGYIRVDGMTKVDRRSKAVDEFQESSAIQLGILSLAVAGTGLTLTKADIVLFAELCWVPNILAQAEDRAHRIGRVGDVTVEYIIAEGSLDDLMGKVLQHKVGVVGEIVDGCKQAGAGILERTREDVTVDQFDVRDAVGEAVDGERNVE